MSRRKAPSVNSGSMADIAFLLLIFFLLTTTISAEKGIKRNLPTACPVPQDCLQTVEEENIFRILTNAESELMVDDEIVSLTTLKAILIEFIDNNGEGNCDYCNGEQSPTSSEHPKKAHISMSIHPKTKYKDYVLIQDEISKAYYELRAAYANNVFRKNPNDLNQLEMKQTKEAYPFNLIEIDN